MHPVPPITRAIVHACELLREGLRTVAERQGRMEVVLVRCHGEDLGARWHRDGVLVVVPHAGSAIQAVLQQVSWLRQRPPATGVVVRGNSRPCWRTASGW